MIGPLIAGVLVVQTHGFALYAYGIDAVLFTADVAKLYSALRAFASADQANR